MKVDSQKRQSPTGIKDLAHQTLRNSQYGYDVIIITVLSNVLIIFPALFSLQVYDKVLTSRNQITLTLLCLILVAVLVAVGALEYVRKRFVLVIYNQLESKIIREVYLGTISMMNKTSSDPSFQVINDLANLKRFITGGGLFKYLDAPWAPIYLVIMFLFNFWLGIFSVFTVAILLILAIYNEKFVGLKTLDANKSSNGFTQKVLSDIRSVNTIESMGLKTRLVDNWILSHEASGIASNQATISEAKISGLTKFVRSASQSLVLALAALFVIKGDLSGGAIIASTILIARILNPIEGAIAYWKDFRTFRESYLRLASLISIEKREKYKTVNENIKGHIIASGIVASYPKLKYPVIKNANIEIVPGEVCVITGSNGSGKSTLLRVLCGGMEPLHGRVNIDGSDIYKWNMDELGKHIGYLGQEPHLFSGTIAQNISRFIDSESSAIIDAASKVGVHDEIMKLEMGYESRVGYGGLKLSAGQEQKICLARAIYGNIKLLALDEPTNFLDADGISSLIKLIFGAASSGAAVLIASHDKEIYKIANKVFYVKDATVSNKKPVTDNPILHSHLSLNQDVIQNRVTYSRV